MEATAATKTEAETGGAQGGAQSWVDRLWGSILERTGLGGAGRTGTEPRGADGAAAAMAELPPLERAKRLAEALLSERGEASGAAVARELQAASRELDADGRATLYRFVAENFGPDAARLRAAAEAWLSEPTPENAARLAEASEPPRQELLRRMNMTPGGTAALVAARREVLGRLREEPALKALDSDLKHLLGSWFNRGFLELRRIDWQTPAAVLEKLIQYEAVHEIQGWDDLRRRLAADRRCFGFFHPALPGEPLIFVEVALVEGLASAVQPLLARDEACEDAGGACAARADTAIFYSISNCQEGLRGISFGNFLIKQVVEELKAELPRLERFATLSPVPGFRRWLEGRLASADADLLRGEERPAVLAAAGGGDATAALAVLLRADGWWDDAAQAEALRAPLTRLCAEYLTAANGGRGPRDPVARFHLGNGARLERVNWLGNTAPRGMRESFGLMVNYLYDLQSIEANHEAFVRNGAVARSAQVEALLAP
ncbi:MAG: Malonyl-CoA decarboxylase [uncultured Acetobacteraceae bacterium]|uniref:Malonyl-CoA decarboxylase n=1 Tax=uncultured Acetobacteraceae bacterium TaxID=169975 RepID=A0A6J4ILE8_9PROT|nr:MAG: Malonyl-CoA decarboxylase [uncultured Acetobacteraceae bacterium]